MGWLRKLLSSRKSKRELSHDEQDIEAKLDVEDESQVFGQLLEQLPKPVIEPEPDRIAQISYKLDRIQANLREHDEFVRQNVAKEDSIQNLRQVLGQLLGQVPSQTEQILSSLERISGRHKELLNLLIHLEDWESLTYEEIAERMRCSPSRIRSYVSDLKNIGIELEMTKVGKKSAVKLNKQVLGQLLGQEGRKPSTERAETEQ